MTTELPRIDQKALKVNQAFIIGLLLVAFVGDLWLLVSFVALVMITGTAFPELSLFKQIYRRVIRPLGLIHPQMIAGNPEPHRFAQGLGGAVLAVATLSFLAGMPGTGWALTWLVILVATLNLLLGICAGCFLYYQFNQLGSVL